MVINELIIFAITIDCYQSQTPRINHLKFSTADPRRNGGRRKRVKKGTITYRINHLKLSTTYPQRNGGRRKRVKKHNHFFSILFVLMGALFFI